MRHAAAIARLAADLPGAILPADRYVVLIALHELLQHADEWIDAELRKLEGDEQWTGEPAELIELGQVLAAKTAVETGEPLDAPAEPVTH